jgi:hypothetical protein
MEVDVASAMAPFKSRQIHKRDISMQAPFPQIDRSADDHSSERMIRR